MQYKSLKRKLWLAKANAEQSESRSETYNAAYTTCIGKSPARKANPRHRVLRSSCRSSDDVMDPFQLGSVREKHT